MRYKNILIGILLVCSFMLFVFLLKENTKVILCVLTMYYFVGLISKSKKQTLTIISPILIIFIISFFQKDTLFAVTYFYLFFIPFATVLGFYFKNINILLKIFIPILFIPLGLFLYPNWFEYYENYGARTYNKSPEINLKNDFDENIRIDTIKNKIIVLDFWTTNCGICLETFPEVEKISNEFKNNTNVVFYTVNIPIRGDKIFKTKLLFKKQKVSLIPLFADNTSISDSLNFNEYPHLIILQNGYIKYNGRLNVNENIKINYLKDEINRLIKV